MWFAQGLPAIFLEATFFWDIGDFSAKEAFPGKEVIPERVEQEMQELQGLQKLQELQESEGELFFILKQVVKKSSQEKLKKVSSESERLGIGPKPSYPERRKRISQEEASFYSFSPCN